MSGTTVGVRAADLTEEELLWLHMGPFDGGLAGLVRRIRRILDVSQRGLAELLGHFLNRRRPFLFSLLCEAQQGGLMLSSLVCFSSTSKQCG